MFGAFSCWRLLLHSFIFLSACIGLKNIPVSLQLLQTNRDAHNIPDIWQAIKNSGWVFGVLLILRLVKNRLLFVRKAVEVNKCLNLHQTFTVWQDQLAFCLHYSDNIIVWPQDSADERQRLHHHQKQDHPAVSGAHLHCAEGRCWSPLWSVSSCRRGEKVVTWSSTCLCLFWSFDAPDNFCLHVQSLSGLKTNRTCWSGVDFKGSAAGDSPSLTSWDLICNHNWFPFSESEPTQSSVV